MHVSVDFVSTFQELKPISVCCPTNRHAGHQELHDSGRACGVLKWGSCFHPEQDRYQIWSTTSTAGVSFTFERNYLSYLCFPVCWGQMLTCPIIILTRDFDFLLNHCVPFGLKKRSSQSIISGYQLPLNLLAFTWMSPFSSFSWYVLIASSMYYP